MTNLRFLLISLLAFMSLNSTAIVGNDSIVTIGVDSLRYDEEDTRLWETISGNIDKVATKVKKRVKDLDEFDRTYIETNYYNYTAMLQNTNYWQQYRFSATDELDRKQSINISPRSAIKIGPYFGWRWIFLGYTVDVGSFGKARKNTEFNLSLYSTKIGGDLVYIRNKSDFKIGTIKGFNGVDSERFSGYSFDGMKAYSTMLNVYYVFNHKHFSYPAAYAQSTIQRISAGSFILGFRYDLHKIHFDHTYLPQDLLYDKVGNERLFSSMKIDMIKYYNLGVSFGYAYNWVFAKNWLFNFSLTPALGYKKTRGEPWDKSVLIDDVKSFNIDFTGRTALVWNNRKVYAGASFITYGYGYKKAYFNFRNFINYLNVYVGVNFNKKRQYRNQ